MKSLLRAPLIYSLIALASGFVVPVALLRICYPAHSESYDEWSNETVISYTIKHWLDYNRVLSMKMQCSGKSPHTSACRCVDFSMHPSTHWFTLRSPDQDSILFIIDGQRYGPKYLPYEPSELKMIGAALYAAKTAYVVSGYGEKPYALDIADISLIRSFIERLAK